jgi:hypothetical protein
MTNKRIFATLTLLFLAAAPNLHAKCSNATLKGTYVYSSQGFTEVTPGISPAGFVPWAQTGLIVFDGKGNVTSGTFTVATTTPAGGTQRGTFTGTYSVNGDCTGTSLTDLGDGTVFHFDLVIQGPSRYTAINTDPGAFMSVYSARKIAEGQQEAEVQ